MRISVKRVNFPKTDPLNCILILIVSPGLKTWLGVKSGVVQPQPALTPSNFKVSLLEEIKSFHFEVVEDTSTFITLQLTGEKEKIDSFLKKIPSGGILELVRTGVIAIQRG